MKQTFVVNLNNEGTFLLTDVMEIGVNENELTLPLEDLVFQSSNGHGGFMVSSRIQLDCPENTFQKAVLTKAAETSSFTNTIVSETLVKQSTTFSITSSTTLTDLPVVQKNDTIIILVGFAVGTGCVLVGASFWLYFRKRSKNVTRQSVTHSTGFTIPKDLTTAFTMNTTNVTASESMLIGQSSSVLQTFDQPAIAKNV